MPRLFLIDGSSQMYRAYHAIRGLTGPDGRSTNAVYGFATMLRKLIADHAPEYIAASFDLPGRTFRDELAADYKANRAPMPPDLAEQVPLVREACEALGVPVLAGVAAWLVFNAVRFGNPFDAGYLRDPIPAFGSPVLPGIAALLFSPSASLFLYSPVALVGLTGMWRMARTGDRSIAWLLGSIIATFVVFYAFLGNWLGGRSYGSRYLVVVLPFCVVGWAVLLSGWSCARRRGAVAIVMTAGALLQMPGVLVDYSKVSQDVAALEGRFTREQRQWQWKASPLVLNARALRRALPDNIAYVTGRRPIPRIAKPETDADRGFAQQFRFSLDLWWLYLYYLHILPRAALGVIVTAFLVFATICTRRLAQALEAPDGGAADRHATVRSG